MGQTDIEDFLVINDSVVISRDKKEPKEKQIIDPNFPEGLYFGMSEEQYHKLPYFSRSAAEDIIFDLEEFKYRKENPIEQTEAMLFGTSIHAVFLEPDKFRMIYVKEPSYEDFPNKIILKTVDDLRGYLKSKDARTTGNKPILIIRAKEFLFKDKEVIIWDDIIANFQKKAERDKQIILTNENYDALIGIVESFNRRKDIKQIICNGYPEITIIWRDKETQIMCKCRLDYARPEAIGELKSFSVKGRKCSLQEAVYRDISMNWYNFQFAIYRDALETIIKKIKAEKAQVFGEVDKIWLEKFLEDANKEFYILSIRTQAPYQIKASRLLKSEKSYDGQTINEYYRIGRENWKYALEKYKRALDSGVWVEKELETLADTHVPQVAYQSIMY